MSQRSKAPTDAELFITYAYDDPDTAPVLDVSRSLKQARKEAAWRSSGPAFIYRVERLREGEYGNETFVESIG